MERKLYLLWRRLYFLFQSYFAAKLANSPGRSHQARSADSIQNEKGAKNAMRSHQPRPENLNKDKRSKIPMRSRQPKPEHFKKDKRSKNPMRSRQPRPKNLKKDKRSKKPRPHPPMSENPKNEKAIDYYYYYYGNDYGSDYGN